MINMGNYKTFDEMFNDDKMILKSGSKKALWKAQIVKYVSYR